MRTILLEKTVLVGGLATTGLINVYLPLCDGNGRQVTFGLAEELLRLSIRYGPGDVPAGWRQARNAKRPERYQAVFSPAAFVLALDEALANDGVEVWLDTLVTAAVMEGDRVAGVEVETKAGRGRFLAACVVDATGDADVAFRAAAECFESGNWPALWALEASRQAMRESPDAGLFKVVVLSKGGARELEPPGGGLRGTDPEQVTRFVLDGRRGLRERYAKLHASDPATDRRSLFPIALPAMAQFRTTRGIVGRTVLEAGQEGRSFADSIGMAADWRCAGRVWEIPFGALVPAKTRGLLAAGRCIASRDDAWHVTRVIPVAALTGQAAGLAAAMSARSGLSPGDLNVDELQGLLRRCGVLLHFDELPDPATR
jgi:hypothetical protein